MIFLNSLCGKRSRTKSFFRVLSARETAFWPRLLLRLEFLPSEFYNNQMNAWALIGQSAMVFVPVN